MRKGFVFLLLFQLAYSSYSQSISPKGPVNICAGQNQLLTVIDADPGEKFQWQKDGTDIAGATNATYNANANGDYTVVLSGGKKIAAVKVIINAYPIAGFTSSATPGQCSNEEIVFTNTSTGAASYLWDFGDPKSVMGNKSTQKDPRHTFIGDPGNGTQTFTVTMTAESAAGGCATSKTATIITKQIPDGALDGDLPAVFQGKSYFKICANVMSGDFTIINESKTKATNSSYRISWGDGTPDYVDNTGSNFVSLKHTYPFGTNKLTLTIVGQNGCTAVFDYYVFVGTNPAVGFANPGNTGICSGSAISFPISQTSNNAPGTIYTVTFNDGSKATEYIHPAVPASETHTFEMSSCGTNSFAGLDTYLNSFLGSIKASSPCGSSSSTIVPIYVSEKPKADFAISKDTICINSKVTFTNTTLALRYKSNSVNWLWFGSLKYCN